MKPERVVTLLLGIAVVVLLLICLRPREVPAPEKPKDVWHTNTVELWRTNTVVMWHTNSVELWRTNTVVESVTREVVKEVPARISDTVKNAAVSGYSYGNAPKITGGSEALYKVQGVTFQLQLTGSARELLSDEEFASLQSESQQRLRAQQVTLAKDSPHHLRLQVTPLWTTDVPAVLHCLFRLELSEAVLLTRQSDALKGEGVTWSAARLVTVPKDGLAEGLRNAVQAQLDQFGSDLLQARKKAGAIASQLPTLPSGFFE